MPLVVTEKPGPQAGAEDSIAGGLVKVRRFWVNTRDELKAIKETGIPRKGDILGAAYPGLIVTSIRGASLGGIDNADGYGGASEVTVTYSVFGSQFGDTPKEVQPPGVKHTVLTVSSETVEVGSAVNNDGTLFVATVPFNNGKTTSKIIGRVRAEVYDFRPATYTPQYATYIERSSDPALNLTTLSLPAPLGATATISIAPKKALYVGFRVETRPDSILIVHDLMLAESFGLTWAIPDATGAIVAFGGGPTLQSGQIYRAVDLNGLW